MVNNKILILLPDGIGLRNFAYSDFYEIGKKEGFQMIYWNNTPFDLQDLGFQEIRITKAKTHPLTDIYKNARKQIELNLNQKKTKDTVYNSYRFPYSHTSFKKILKNTLQTILIYRYSSQKGLLKICKRIKDNERKTLFYQQSRLTLENEKPAFVFCTNQRPVLAIAPLLAAQDLGIPTATFIFSWDNLPKATMVVETDYYFVWSEHMKAELMFYYPEIQSKAIFVTGTPQFESHFDKSKIGSRLDFFIENQLDLRTKYICYSGDDGTTCPDDPQYLEDLALAIRHLNEKGHSLAIIFRRCPVDFSERFDKILEQYEDIIVAINPKWEQIGDMWNAILPRPEDLILQINTIAYSEMVVNLGSSMVFDYAAHAKPCAFINYDVTNKVLPNWTVEKIYNYIHFRSMPNKSAVIWLNSKKEIESKIEEALMNSKATIKHAEDWFKIINQYPPQNASQRIWNQIRICLITPFL